MADDIDLYAGLPGQSLTPHVCPLVCPRQHEYLDSIDPQSLSDRGMPCCYSRTEVQIDISHLTRLNEPLGQTFYKQ